MTTTLGGVTLPEPQDPEISEGWEGTRTTSHSGVVLIDYTNLYRFKWELEWIGMTQTNRDTLRTRYEVAASQAFVPPYTSASYSVVVVRGTWKERVYKRGARGAKFDISFELEEVS